MIRIRFDGRDRRIPSQPSPLDSRADHLHRIA
jgi:hypothetical protein